MEDIILLVSKQLFATKLTFSQLISLEIQFRTMRMHLDSTNQDIYHYYFFFTNWGPGADGDCRIVRHSDRGRRECFHGCVVAPVGRALPSSVRNQNSLPIVMFNNATARLYRTVSFTW